MTCSACSWYLDKEFVREEDLKPELEKAGIDGFGVEPTNNFFFMPNIVNAEIAVCGKFSEM